eukprot:s1251_g16.t1
MASSSVIQHGLRGYLQACDKSVEQQNWNFLGDAATHSAAMHKFSLLTWRGDSLGVGTQLEVSPRSADSQRRPKRGSAVRAVVWLPRVKQSESFESQTLGSPCWRLSHI